MRVTEIQGAELALEKSGESTWRLIIKDNAGVVWVTVPDQIMRAIAMKVTTGKTIEIAGNMPQVKSVFDK